ncbi:MAG: formylglycine-generating enzyme family protein, partial [Bdellovibrionia bacterium]
YPAVYVSYVHAKQFARVMELLDPSAHYRLPTEAEFEYAARAGTTTEYYWGDEMDPSFAFYKENVSMVHQHAQNVKSCPVASLEKKYPGYCANDFGLMHMLGNVWQWTSDAYTKNYESASIDGNQIVTGPSDAQHVNRGGCWASSATYLRSSFRNEAPNGSSEFLGFRLVRLPKTQ